MIAQSTKKIIFSTLLCASAIVISHTHATGLSVAIAAPIIDQPKPPVTVLQTTVLSGGHFWGAQGVFQHVRGVETVYAGYTGGDKATAQYVAVNAGNTEHAEAVEIIFDSSKISYGELLRIFFSVAHDPTQLNGQGPDQGKQYRSAIFYYNESQKNIAEAYIKQLDKSQVFGKPIVTRVESSTYFYKAEDSHQDFLIRNPKHQHVVAYDLPKIASLKKLYPNQYLAEPIRVTKTAESEVKPK